MGTKTAVKKVVVVHRTDGGGTVCGRNVHLVARSNKTWKGVTCKRCLKSKPVKKTAVKTQMVRVSTAGEFPSGKLQ